MLIALETRKLQLRHPLVTAHGSTTHRNIIEITASEDGFQGHGEAAPLPGFGLETFDESLAALESWVKNPHRLPDAPAARSGANTAIENLEKASSSTTPTSGKIAVQALIGSAESSSIESEVSRALEQGYLAIKLKVAATDKKTDIARIQRAIQLVGPHAALRLDANGGWSLEDALYVLSAIDSNHVDLVEEPTANPLDWKKVREVTGVKIGADEQLTNELQVHQLLEHAAAQTFVLKPSVIGGPSATRKVAELAQSNDVNVLISSFLDGPIALRSARDLAMELAPNEIHGLGTASLFIDEFPDDVVPTNGFLHY